MVVTGLTITPITTLETEAQFSGAITSNMDNGSNTASFYWRDEIFELTFSSDSAVTTSDFNITGKDFNGATISGAKDQFEIVELSSPSDQSGTYKSYTARIHIKADAQGGEYGFTIKDANGGNIGPKTIYVYDTDIHQSSHSYENNAFFNSARAFTEEYVYSRAAYDKALELGKTPVSFSFDESLNEELKVEVSEPNLSSYRGCVAYTVTITPLKYKDAGGNPIIPIMPKEDRPSDGILSLKNAKLEISYIDFQGQETQTDVDYTIKQAFTSIDRLRLIDCTNATAYMSKDANVSTTAEYVAKYPHLTEEGSTIYLDANETVYFVTVLRGSLVDAIKTAISGLDRYINTDKEQQADKYGCEYKSEIKVLTDENIIKEIWGESLADQLMNDAYPVLIKLTVNKNVSTDRPESFTISTDSGSAGATYNVVIYNTYIDVPSHIPGVECYDTTWKSSDITLRYDRFGTQEPYEFRTTGIDTKENIIWTTDKYAIASFSGGELYKNDPTLQKVIQSRNALLSIKNSETITVTARTEENLTRPYGAITTGNSWTVQEVVLPEQGQLKIKYGSVEMTADELPVNTNKKYVCEGKGYNQYNDLVDMNYSNIRWYSTDTDVATVDNNGNVTTKKQGKTKIYTETVYPYDYNRSNVKSNEMELVVYNELTKLDVLDVGGASWGDKTVEAVAGRTYILKGDKRGKNDEESSQAIQWMLPDASYARIKRAEGYAAANEWVEGDQCELELLENTDGNVHEVILQCRPVQKSTPSSRTTIQVKPEIMATSVVLDYTGESIREAVGTDYTVVARQYADENQTSNSNELLVWESGDTGVVQVTPNLDGSSAKLRIVGTGTTQVTVRTESGNAETSVTVTGIIKANRISYTYNTQGTNLAIGETATFTATLDPGNATDQIEWIATPQDAVSFEPVDNRSVKVSANSDAVPGSTVKIKAYAPDGNATSTEVTFTIRQSVTAAVVHGVENSYPYSGAAINPVYNNPEFYLEVGGIRLTQGRDYNYNINNNYNVGTAKIVITGIGNYSGTKTIEFTIEPGNVQDATVTVNGGNKITYTGNAITPAISVKLNERIIYSPTDYEATFVNNVNAGTATITIKGKGNYAGTLNTTFVIEKKDISTLYPQIADAYSIKYTGSKLTPEVTIKDGINELEKSKDYTVAYKDNLNVGTATITATGIGNYTGSKESTFVIGAAMLTADQVVLSKTDYVYNGKQCKPKVTVYDASFKKKLKVNKDYTVTYPVDMTNMGVKNISIMGKGNYSGSVSVQYGIAEKVTVKKATIKSAKNSKAKKVVVQIKKVSGADGYEITYSTSKKFPKADTKVVTSKKNKVTISKLKKGKTYYFKVRAYKVNSIGREIYGKASAVKKVKIKK